MDKCKHGARILCIQFMRLATSGADISDTLDLAEIMWMCFGYELQAKEGPFDSTVSLGTLVWRNSTTYQSPPNTRKSLPSLTTPKNIIIYVGEYVF